MLASELIEEVRAAGSITADILDAEILRAADAEIRTRLLPMMRNLNEEYLVRTIDIVAVNGRVPLPPRAAGAGVRLVQMISAGQLYQLARIDPALDPGTQASSGQPIGFYFDGGSIVLVPSSSGGTFRVRYYARPGKLVSELDTTKCAAISAVSVGASTTLLTLGTYTGPAVIDVVASGPAHQHKAIGVTLGPIANTDIFETPIAGDYVSGADTTPFVALPEELGSTLALRTAERLLAGLGFVNEAGVQASRAEAAQRDAEMLLRPRSDGNPKKLSGGLLSRLNNSTPFPWRGW